MTEKQTSTQGGASRSRTIILLMLLVVSIAIAYLSSRLAGMAEAKPNVLLISIDTCRPDRIGAYGAPGTPTPNIDRLAQEGVLFEKALTPVPSTLPGHVTMLSGLIPSWHGVLNNETFTVPKELPLLPDELKKQGYDTMAVIAAFVLDGKFGLAPHFDVYRDDVVAEGEPTSVGFHYAEIKADEVTDRAIQLIGQPRENPFFAFVHYYDAHHEYKPPPPFDSRFSEDPYQGEIAFVDQQIGRLVAALEEKGMLDNTLVVITSDHAESLGEHGEMTHGIFVYEATLSVPLIMRWPAGIEPGSKVSGVVGTQDIVATVLNLAGFIKGPYGQGLSLVEAIDSGQAPDQGRIFMCETYIPRFNYGWSELKGYRKDGMKYIMAPRPELYDLKNDPKELDNLVKDRPALAEKMKRELLAYIPDQSMQNLQKNIDYMARKNLESLGYMSANPQNASMEENKKDPKDYVELLVPLAEARSQLLAHDYQKAREKFLEALSYDPDSMPLKIYATDCLHRDGQYEKAFIEYKNILEMAPGNAPVLKNIVTELIFLDRGEEALQYARRLVKADASPLHQSLLIEAAVKAGQDEVVTKSCQSLRDKYPDFPGTPEVCGLR